MSDLLVRLYDLPVFESEARCAPPAPSCATGVDEAMRGQGIGEALLVATLRAMREAGCAYGVIGDPGPVEFYKKRLDAVEIPKSTPGHCSGMLGGKPAGRH